MARYLYGYAANKVGEIFGVEHARLRYDGAVECYDELTASSFPMSEDGQFFGGLDGEVYCRHAFKLAQDFVDEKNKSIIEGMVDE